MEITLNLRRGSLKPEAVEDQLDRVDDLLPDENSPRALYGTDSPVANRKPQISPKAKRPRRTAAVLFEEMRMLSFMNQQHINVPILSDSSIFMPSEEIYAVHVAAYFGDDTALEFLLACGADANRKTSQGRTALDIAEHFNTFGSHDRFISIMKMIQRQVA